MNLLKKHLNVEDFKNAEKQKDASKPLFLLAPRAGLEPSDQRIVSWLKKK